MSIVKFRSVDFETSRLDDGEIVEWGYTDLYLDTDTRECGVDAPTSRLWGISGQMDPAAQGVHHIRLDAIDGLPVIDESDLRSLVEGCDFLVAHNLSFEQRYLTPEITGAARWVCTYKAAKRAWEEAPDHKLQTLRYWRGLDLDPDLALPAHRAGPDAYVGAMILAELVKTETVNDLVRWTKMPTHYITCPLGKHRGARWCDIPHGYLRWIVDKADEMESDVRHAALAEINRRAEQGGVAP